MLVLNDENEAYSELLCGHLLRFTRRLRAIPVEHWEWQPNPAVPSPRYLAQHAWLWLVSDRQHILEPDALRHSLVSDPPVAQAELCTLLDEETEEWRTLLRAMGPEQFAEVRLAFNWRRVNVRWLVHHMCGNVIYKHGQLATLYFQLGLDGEAPYQAPLPQRDYDRLAEMMRHPVIRWTLTEEVTDADPSAIPTEIDATDQAGCTALHYAVWRGEAKRVRLLLEGGAEVNRSYGEGWTALVDAVWLKHLEVVQVLLSHGADTTWRTTSGYTALGIALEGGDKALINALQKAQRSGEHLPHTELGSR